MNQIKISTLLWLILLIFGTSFVLSETYTQAEVSALEKFRPLINKTKLWIPEHERSEAYLVKWLRARNLSPDKAFRMVLETQKWRNDHHVNGILNETIYNFRNQPFTTDGFDREGFPILTLAITELDFRKLIIQSSVEKLYRYFIQVLELASSKRKEASVKFGKEITKATVILDFHGFSIRSHTCLPCVPFLRDLFTTFEKYYPGSLRHAVIVNVPRAAKPILDFLKPLLASETTKVMAIFDTDRRKWLPYLHRIADSSQLPIRFGGKMRPVINNVKG